MASHRTKSPQADFSYCPDDTDVLWAHYEAELGSASDHGGLRELADPSALAARARASFCPHLFLPPYASIAKREIGAAIIRACSNSHISTVSFPCTRSQPADFQVRFRRRGFRMDRSTARESGGCGCSQGLLLLCHVGWPCTLNAVGTPCDWVCTKRNTQLDGHALRKLRDALVVCHIPSICP